MYYQAAGQQPHFWKEKAADFAKTAEEVLAKRSQSGAAVQYIADYFYWGLGHRKRAIEILFVAHKQKLLDEAGQAQLVDFLHRENRFGESIAVLQPLVERRPENIDYRVQLMHAYFRTGRKAELLALLKQTDAFFHREGPLERERRWPPGPELACKTNFTSKSVAYFKELIPLHERTAAEPRHRQRHARGLLRRPGQRLRRPQEDARGGRGGRRRHRRLGRAEQRPSAGPGDA